MLHQEKEQVKQRSPQIITTRRIMPSNFRLDSLLITSVLLASPLSSNAFTGLRRTTSFVVTPPTSRLCMLHPIKSTKEKDLTATEAIANGNLDHWKSNSRNNVSSDSDSYRLGNLAELLNLEHGNVETAAVAALGIGALASAVALLTHGMDVNLPPLTDLIASAQSVLADPNAALQGVVTTVESMGPLGALYFGVVYTIAEILAIPAFPLTASAGYLFGVTKGTTVVLASASVAAAVSFVIGRTLLRSYVENLLLQYPQFQKIDKAIGKEGFKLMLLLRLSPIFPFALSNYLYGASSVGFLEYFFGTMLGFTPGTIAYVYSGQVGKALTIGGGDTQPLYVYAGGFVLLAILLKTIADVATGIIEDINEE